MKKQQGSIHLIIIAALTILLVGSLGFIAWQNFVNKPKGPSDRATANTGVVPGSTEKTVPEAAPEIKEGTITGSLTYPSEGIPAELEVHAYNIDTKSDYYTKDQVKGSQYRYGIGYKLTVPEGNYYVYGILPSLSQQKAYYDEFVKCGMETNCTDFSKIKVTVVAGKETGDIMVGDWYKDSSVQDQ